MTTLRLNWYSRSIFCSIHAAVWFGILASLADFAGFHVTIDKVVIILIISFVFSISLSFLNFIKMSSDILYISYTNIFFFHSIKIKTSKIIKIYLLKNSMITHFLIIITNEKPKKLQIAIGWYSSRQIAVLENWCRNRGSVTVTPHLTSKLRHGDTQ